MMKLFVLAALFAVAQCLDLNHQEWMNFKQTYGKSYKNSKEEQMRFDIFLKNKDLIQEHNQKFDAGQVPYKLRINHLADLTDEELDKLRGYKGDSGMTNNSVVFPSNSWVPKSVDWRAKGAVTPVKNQAHCGACWAFSVTGAIEGQIFRKNGELISLSEQQLIDCINDIVGCYGGRTNIGFKYAVHKGLEPERSYPYQAHDQKCRYNKTNVVADVKDFIRLPFGSDVELMKAVATIGPISVVIDSKGHPFHLYGSGVFSTEVSGDMCRDSKYLNHAVLLVGYGTEDGQDYWLIKNSWGPLWGDAGYIKVSRSNSNQLCISTRAMYPVL